MFFKILFLFLISLTTLLSIEITLKPTENNELNRNEGELLRYMMLSKGVKIDLENAVKLGEENRLLANYYLREYELNEDLIVEMTLTCEDKLRKLTIEKELKKVDINNKVLLSYYKNNKAEFYVPSKITFTVYSYENFEDALGLYENYSKELDGINDYAEKSNAKIINQELDLLTLHPELKNLLKDDTTSGYLTPPQRFKSAYIVMEIKKILPRTLAPFENVKKEVRKALEIKIRRDFIRSLLEKIEKPKKN